MSQLNVDTIGSQTGTTISIASGHTLAGMGVLKEVDQWQLTANFTTAGDNDITSNLARPSGTLQGAYIGTGMSESSGIFTFPSTGIWLIQVSAYINATTNDGCALGIVGTNDNFSTQDVLAQAITGKYNSGYKDAATSFTQTIVDITDTANDKIKFQAGSVTSGTSINGSSTTTITTFVFMKLGET